MIKRQAVLIGNSGGYRGLDFRGSVSIDLENYYDFLQSKAGGEWHQDEIKVLKEPNLREVVSTIESIEADYTFTVFIGHGIINSYDSTDHVCLKDENLTIGKLVSKSYRQTLIIDACKQIELHSSIGIQQAFDEVERSADVSKKTRDLFDTAISQTPTGVIVVFATQHNQVAYVDESRGGCFSYSLLKSGRDWWANENSVDILRLNIAVNKAEIMMREIWTINQKPAFAGQVRRLTFPPFACSRK